MKKYFKLNIFGDSLVSCSKLKKKHRWPEMLKNKINKENKKFKLITHAINGITTTEALAKINFNINKKSIVILLFGANDSTYYQSLKGKPRVNLNLFTQNYTKIINKTKKNKNNPKIIKNSLVFIISAIALIILLDTFKFQLNNYLPGLDLILNNLYESLKDLLLFFKDLIN